MNHMLRRLPVTVTQQASALNQSLCGSDLWKHVFLTKSDIFFFGLVFAERAPSIQHPAWCCAPGNERQYKGMPTHGIGRWKYLLPKQAPKKKKDRNQSKQILSATDTAYGTLNVKVSGYDMTLVEHYSQYIHNLCNRLGIDVAESYALPTKSTEVMLVQDQGNKTYVDAILKTHQRVVQMSSLNASLCPVFVDVLLKNQPEGVQLSVKEHTEADFQARFKARPELEGLLAQISQ